MSGPSLELIARLRREADDAHVEFTRALSGEYVRTVRVPRKPYPLPRAIVVGRHPPAWRLRIARWLMRLLA